ncbi:hypothetical protein LZ32DRAFT_688091 [Colletotrichum eremochloae]|nr:hypothetical protein LZ32DRAFT_688091 [Colletotrichum eremochloae]
MQTNRDFPSDPATAGDHRQVIANAALDQEVHDFRRISKIYSAFDLVNCKNGPVFVRVIEEKDETMSTGDIVQLIADNVHGVRGHQMPRYPAGS